MGTLNLRQNLDPELHILRSAVRTIEDRSVRAEAATARHKLFESLDSGELGDARRWLSALKVALDTMPGDFDAHTYWSVRNALKAITEALVEA